MKRTRRNHGATLKAQVAVAAVPGDKTLAELAEQFRVHPTQITEWRQQLLAQAAEVFGGPTPPADTPDLKTLHAKIGQLALEHDFFSRGLTKAGLLRDLLRHEGHAVGRCHVATLMRRMGLEAWYRKPHLSRRHPALTPNEFIAQRQVIEMAEEAVGSS